MKKVFLLTTVIAFISISFSCKKDNSPTASQRLQHNWTLVNFVENSHDANGDNIQTTNAIAGDFMDFSASGTVTFKISGQSGVATYSMIGDTKILFNSTDTLTIKTLTDTQLALYVKDVISATEYDEETINLKR